VVAVVTVLVVGAVVTAYVRRTAAATPGIVPGYMEDASAVTDPMRTITVQLPQQTLKVSVAKPVDEVSRYELGEDLSEATMSKAGRDARIVQLSWQAQPRQTSLPLAYFPARQFGLALVADGERYDLRSAGSGGGRYVVVAGHAEHLQVEVTYEGVTQTADVRSGEVTDQGRAAPYYRAPVPARSPAGTCAMLTPAQRRAYDAYEPSSGPAPCQLGSVTSVPYLPEVGWAPAGRSWWVIQASVSWPNLLETTRTDDGPYAAYGVRFAGPLSVTLDGTAPTTVLLPRSGGRGLPGASGFYVFSLRRPPTRLHVTAPYVARKDLAGMPGPTTVRFGPGQGMRLVASTP